MSDIVRPRPRPLWRLFIVPALLFFAAVAWSAFWFYAASKVDDTADAWRAQEAKAGRIYDCGKRSIAGFPFRLEVRCTGVNVVLISQSAGQTGAQEPITARLGEILIVAQVYDPKLLIAEFTAPATISSVGEQPAMIVNWSKARSSVAGLPAIPQRVSLVFDDPAIDRVDAAIQTPLARAKHVELHTRFSSDATPDRPVVETVLQMAGASVRELHPILAEPFDADIRMLLTGLKDVAPKPWPQRFRELQIAGGHVEIVQSRVQQGDTIAVASGTLGLSPNGRLDGELQMTVAGIERLIPAFGLDKMMEESAPQTALDGSVPGAKTQNIGGLLGALDRAIPGLGKVVRQNVNVGAAIGINMLGTAATLEGKKARAFPVRFTDGAVYLGPIKVAQTPPLF